MKTLSAALLTLLLCVAKTAAQTFELSVAPQIVMGASTSPGHMRSGMPGASMRVSAALRRFGVFGEATRWFSTPTFCRDGDCDFTVVFGATVFQSVGRSEIGARAGYGFVAPGPVRNLNRSVRAGATWSYQFSQRNRIRMDLQYENWRIAYLDFGRFGESFCCRHSNMDSVLGSAGFEFIVGRR